MAEEHPAQLPKGWAIHCFQSDEGDRSRRAHDKLIDFLNENKVAPGEWQMVHSEPNNDPYQGLLNPAECLFVAIYR